MAIIERWFVHKIQQKLNNEKEFSMPAKDKKLVNFSEDHELNNKLRKHNKRQTDANREKLKEIGSEAKKELEKSRLTHADLDVAIESNIKSLE
jgi:hypothetical protein